MFGFEAWWPFILFDRKYLESQSNTLIKHYDEEITYKNLDFSICTGNSAFWAFLCILNPLKCIQKGQSTCGGQFAISDLDFIEERLLKLKSMLKKGVISDKEYEELRKKTLELWLLLGAVWVRGILV